MTSSPSRTGRAGTARWPRPPGRRHFSSDVRQRLASAARQGASRKFSQPSEAMLRCRPQVPTARSRVRCMPACYSRARAMMLADRFRHPGTGLRAVNSEFSELHSLADGVLAAARMDAQREPSSVPCIPTSGSARSRAPRISARDAVPRTQEIVRRTPRPAGCARDLNGLNRFSVQSCDPLPDRCCAARIQLMRRGLSGRPRRSAPRSHEGSRGTASCVR